MNDNGVGLHIQQSNIVILKLTTPSADPFICSATGK